MPALQLDSLLGRARGDEEPVFPLVRRRDPHSPTLEALELPTTSVLSSTVSIVLLVALLAGIAFLLWSLP